ncbi:hypothetical protein FEM48_Zijuj06G0159200 [Ziziphus jujuba var. spinosa]|uniref:Uncharacterized protein n=1 Tax=Ziziphus jujuba var. spinosa TaxID=714518 RepID=A0A978VA81_ZIZJJ|nr:hypothetical protein FEM48_Zijuj06G0159200 [Ziziphus jujuba var. spinosa]
MGTRWRRAFCTTLSKDPEFKVSEKQQQQTSRSPSPSPRSCTRLSFFSGGSNPSTSRLLFQSQPVSSPSLRCRTPSETVSESPRLECKTTTPKKSKSPKTLLGSNPTSPRSPLKLSLFKNSFKFRSSCGICLNSVKTGHGTAIYTAECAHAFHFPCIVSYVNKHNSLICPVCNCSWKDVPFLAVHKNITPESVQQDQQSLVTKPKTEDVVKKAEPVLRQHTKPSDSRLYDDDERLISPNSGTSQISPIPEVNEDAKEVDHEDVEEFQGFFVNPNPSSSSSMRYSEEAQMINKDVRTNHVQVRLLPEAAVISASRTHETYAVTLRVKAPPPPSSTRSVKPSNRAPIDLVTVLDVSGSMIGPKLHMLKRAMRLVISSLGSGDRLSIVAFSASAKRLMPLRKMTAQGQRNARRIVDQLVCGQGTSVGEALRKATKVLEDRRERNPVASIMLLSDGQDERSVRTNKNNQRHTMNHTTSSTRFAHIEIPVHSFGFGEYESAENEFAKCVGGLLSVVVQDLRIQLGFHSASKSAEISAIYSYCGKPTVLSSRSVRLCDLYAEEEKELLVELRVPITAVGTHIVMSARCLYKDPSTQEVVYEKEQSLVLPAAPDFGRLSNTPKIERLRNQFIAIRAIAESRRLVEHNDYTSGHHLLASARALLMQSNPVFADEYVRALEVELAELHWRRQHQIEQQQQQMVMIQRRRGGEREIAVVDENGDPLTPTSAWRAAEKLAKVAMMKKSLSRVDDLHGFENARF